LNAADSHTVVYSVIEVDEFTHQLWNIYEAVWQEGIAQVSQIVVI